MNKILFLDIDGVLNKFGRTSDRPYPLSEFDPTMVEGLNRILREAKVTDLCISSDWRNTSGLKNIFYEVGIMSPYCSSFSKLEDNLKLMMHNQRRGYEVKYYLDSTYEHKGLKFKYCILDDIDQFLKEQKEYLVLTDYREGLTDENVEMAIKILTKDDN